MAKLHQATSPGDGRPRSGFGTDVETQYAFFECGLRPVVSLGIFASVAIAFARARYISRKTGGNAVRSGAYNGRDKIVAERTGEVFSFAHRDAPDHHEVMLPEGAPEALSDAGTLWNAAEAAERRGDAQVARELVLALPANPEIGPDDRIELARSFAQEHFVSKGLAVQVDVHSPHGADSESERANYHAHLLVTTRRVEATGLSAKKARDLDPVVRQGRGRAVVAEADAWGALWRDHQNRYFAEHGLDIRVDATSAVPQEHIGPIRMRAPDAEANARAEAIAQANALAARDPERVLGVLTRNNATFTERDLDRHLARHIFEDAERGAVRTKVLGHAEVLALHDRETGESAGRFTTRAVRAQEREALADGARVAAGAHRDIGNAARAAAPSAAALRPDQRAAFEHATGAGGLKIIEGRAGTGKSFTLGAIRRAHEAAGYEVVGLAPTNAVAQDLGHDGFKRTSTVHAELFRLKNGHAAWGRRTLVVVDEMAMLDAKVTGELLREAKMAGAKLVGAGDDRQLASIERGGLFTELRRAHGSAEISHVTRQRVDWQREAARDLSEGRFEEALRAFARNKAVIWTTRQADTRSKLVEQWSKDTAADPPCLPLRVRLYQQGCRRAQPELKGGAARARRAWSRPRLHDQARPGRVRGRRPGAVHRHVEGRRHLQRQCRRHHRHRPRDGADQGDARRGGRPRGAAGVVVGIGVHRFPARLRRDDLQGPGQDPRPYLSDAHAALAGGLELCGADAPARERQGVRGRGDGARHPPAGAADRARRDQVGLDRLCDAGRADAARRRLLPIGRGRFCRAPGRGPTRPLSGPNSRGRVRMHRPVAPQSIGAESAATPQATASPAAPAGALIPAFEGRGRDGVERDSLGRGIDGKSVAAAWRRTRRCGASWRRGRSIFRPPIAILEAP